MLTQRAYLCWIYLPCATLIVGFLILARALWVGPEPFNDWWWTISSLYKPQQPEANPLGARFFWGAMVLTSLLVAFMTAFVHPRLVVSNKFFTYCGSAYFIAGAVGIMLVGIFPRRSLDIIHTQLHEYSAVLGAIGVGMGVLCYFLSILVGRVQVRRAVNTSLMVVWGLLAIGIGLSAAISYAGINQNWTGETPIPGVSPFFSIALWEKISFCVLILYLGAVGAIFSPEVCPSRRR